MTLPPPPEPLFPGESAYSTKRHQANLSDCESEPIQTPGCIQSHGVLLVVGIPDGTILQVSENSQEHLGLAPEALLGQPIGRVLTPAGAERLRIVLAKEPVERNPIRLLSLPPRLGARSLDVSVHTIDGVAILEFEPTGRIDGRPEPDFNGLVRNSILRLQTAETVTDCWGVIVAEMRTITGLDRVMLYRFHDDWHGEVVAEAKRDDLPSWLDLHYPAADIPASARAVFLQIGLRPVPDAGRRLAELVPLVNPNTGRPLQMIHCYLRAPSGLYTEYLKNMGAAASLTMPIVRKGLLWGMIVCHHRRPTEFSYQLRAAAEFFARVASLQSQATEELAHLRLQRRLEAIHNQLFLRVIEKNSLTALVADDSLLREDLAVGGAALLLDGRWHRTGQTPTESQLGELHRWLEDRPEFRSPLDPFYASDALVKEFAAAAAYAELGAGLLAVPLAPSGGNVLCLFRPENIRTIYWAGATEEPTPSADTPARALAPRTSFASIADTIRHRSAPWLRAETDWMLRLRLLLTDPRQLSTAG